jgi:hypothetical protein
MKVLAVLVSPLCGVLLIFFPYLFWVAISAYDLPFFTVPMIFVSYVVGLMIQIGIIETIMLHEDFQFSFRRYCWLACFFSLCFIAISTIYVGVEHLGWIFMFYLLYSIGNVLAYNELYFNKLQK